METKETVILSCILMGVLLLATQLFEKKPKLVVYELQYACNPADGDLASSFAFCNTSLSDDDRVTDLVSRLTMSEKVEQLVHRAGNVSRLGLPAYQWWGETPWRGHQPLRALRSTCPRGYQLPSAHLDLLFFQPHPLEQNCPGQHMHCLL